MDGFEVFAYRHGKTAGQAARVSLQKSGALALNRAAFHALGKPTAVVLLYHQTERLIGLRAGNDARAIPVRKQANSENYLIAGCAFTKRYDIDTSETRRYQATLQDDMLIIDLKQPI